MFKLSSKVTTVRTIPFEGIHNFRDMGGYETSDGRKVKYGLFYRAGDLSKMKEEDITKFEKLGVKYIFDYRDENEAIPNPDPVIQNVTNLRVPANREDFGKMPHTSMEGMIKSGFLKTFDKIMLSKFYTNIVFNNLSFKRLIEIIQDPTNLGVLHHCSFGKDRTGIGGAIILLALGVPKETVMEDYLLTNDMLKASNEEMINKVSKYLSDQEVTNLRDILEAKEEYLLAVFEAIDQKYGDVDTFLCKEFGLNQAKRETLQAICLES